MCCRERHGAELRAVTQVRAVKVSFSDEPTRIYDVALQTSSSKHGIYLKTIQKMSKKSRQQSHWCNTDRHRNLPQEASGRQATWTRARLAGICVYYIGQHILHQFPCELRSRTQADEELTFQREKQNDEMVVTYEAMLAIVEALARGRRPSAGAPSFAAVAAVTTIVNLVGFVV